MIEDNIATWEILVPTATPDGKKIKLGFHKKWDEMIRSLCGGLTIYRATKGQWISSQGNLYEEKMIPVQIDCSEEVIRKIGACTKGFYNQEVIRIRKVSDKIIYI